MKRSLALASAVIMLGAVSACGGGDEASSADDYCGTLEEAQQEFGNLQNTDFTAMEKMFDRVSEIADSAPEAVASDWQTMQDTFQSLQDTLDEAGLTMADLQAIQENPTNLPEGVDQQALMEVTKKLQNVIGSEFQDAATSIQDHAEKECGISLGEGSG